MTVRRCGRVRGEVSERWAQTETDTNTEDGCTHLQSAEPRWAREKSGKPVLVLYGLGTQGAPRLASRGRGSERKPTMPGTETREEPRLQQPSPAIEPGHRRAHKRPRGRAHGERKRHAQLTTSVHRSRRYDWCAVGSWMDVAPRRALWPGLMTSAPCGRNRRPPPGNSCG